MRTDGTKAVIPERAILSYMSPNQGPAVSRDQLVACCGPELLDMLRLADFNDTKSFDMFGPVRRAPAGCLPAGMLCRGGCSACARPSSLCQAPIPLPCLPRAPQTLRTEMGILGRKPLGTWRVTYLEPPLPLEEPGAPPLTAEQRRGQRLERESGVASLRLDVLADTSPAA